MSEHREWRVIHKKHLSKITLLLSTGVVFIISCRSAVLKNRWNPNSLIICSNARQNQNICSGGSCSLILLLLAAISWLFIRICLKDVFLLSAWDSVISSKWGNESPSLLVEGLVITENCPTYLLCSISLAPVVIIRHRQKHYLLI